MKVEARYYSVFAQEEAQLAGSYDMPVPHAVSEHIHQQIKSFFQEEREVSIDHQAVQVFCKFAGKALHIAEPLCADVKVEITERHQGEIEFEMQSLYISKDTPDYIKQTLMELIQKADTVLADAGEETVLLLLSYKLS